METKGTINRTELLKSIKEIDEKIRVLHSEKKALEDDLKKIHSNPKVDGFLRTYNGEKLSNKWSLDEYGVWEVRGEDPNCDLGGAHSQPLLGYLEGTLEKVITAAVDMDGFYTWGGGGSIVKAKDRLVIKV